jgi:hypothetical protein
MSKKPQNCGTNYCSCIECVLPKKEQLQRLIEWANLDEERTTDFEDGYQAARDWVHNVGLAFLKKD